MTVILRYSSGYNNWWLNPLFKKFVPQLRVPRFKKWAKHRKSGSFQINGPIDHYLGESKTGCFNRPQTYDTLGGEVRSLNPSRSLQIAVTYCGPLWYPRVVKWWRTQGRPAAWGTLEEGEGMYNPNPTDMTPWALGRKVIFV